MIIDKKTLLSAGAAIKTYIPSEIIFNEGDLANHYFQIISGRVKLNNYNDQGKEIIQALLEDGNSVGESMLFINKPYPINAVAITDCKILRLSKNSFIELLKRHPELCFNINKYLSQKLYFKLIMAKNIFLENPKIRLQTLLDYLKSLQEYHEPFSFQVPLTRQQIANLTGLRVETVIRALKKMEKENILQIENRKIFY
ncbi:CRP-like cAMP-binding protein [Chryseobacterium sp. H1D6B]|uniref:Crp/Fnr family transcriptional regulator n=1 Tax=Chryseobacterium sp. H1D6B TaxID=2940588 RepID=UPI0015CC6AE4|nr:Crp/Fnr family transcriptional regulator [Chryseobacterium sp. H1D6B]MDH6253823.1 CRP-like cAMP-binding protein [Chryseobacterium sp. H1D6B]